MKVVILAGGFGTRLSEYTDLIPKPMVEIGGKPLLIHIIGLYSRSKHSDFYVALGYKSEVIISYFKSIADEIILENKDETICALKIHKNEIRVNLINTGINTMTGGRIKRLSRYISDERFMLTYGDGLSNVNLSELEKFHIQHKKLATITAVQPPARFGGLLLNGNKVLSFREKSKLDQSWINGGFFIFESEFIEFIKNDETFLEREPLESVASKDQLRAYKHEGFWQCMDTKRDLDYMQEIYAKGKIDVFYR
jgi:glucose-1-phosphate cytidylyltransferase